VSGSLSDPVDGSAILSLTEVSREFGGVHAVDGVSVDFGRGRITGLIGPNGAGKSTLIQMISGSIVPSGGTIEFEGRKIGGMPPHRVARLGIVRTFQLSTGFPRLTTLDNVVLGARTQRGERLLSALVGRRSWMSQEADLVERGRQLLDRFGLGNKEREYLETLSGGQKRLVEIMRVLMAEPRLLLLDEPMAGVNLALRSVIEELLLELRASGMTMIVVEHEMQTVRRLCDRVVVMAAGKVLTSGTMDEIQSSREVQDAYLFR
jgi:ABC-type branched-subunit amino acid transport system ATPase component